jgi:hypothetical protein
MARHDGRQGRLARSRLAAFASRLARVRRRTSHEAFDDVPDAEQRKSAEEPVGTDCEDHLCPPGLIPGLMIVSLRYGLTKSTMSASPIALGTVMVGSPNGTTNQPHMIDRTNPFQMPISTPPRHALKNPSRDVAMDTGSVLSSCACAFARLEDVLRSERTKAAFAAAKERGIKLGSPITFETAAKVRAARSVESRLARRGECGRTHPRRRRPVRPDLGSEHGTRPRMWQGDSADRSGRRRCIAGCTAGNHKQTV